MTDNGETEGDYEAPSVLRLSRSQLNLMLVMVHREMYRIVAEVYRLEQLRDDVYTRVRLANATRRKQELKGVLQALWDNRSTGKPYDASYTNDRARH